MDDASWKHFTTIFPGILKGARFEAGAPPASGKQPPFIAGAFSPDEKYVALSGGGRIPCRAGIWVARVPTLESVQMLHGHQGIHALAWDERTYLLASASNDYTTVMWDCERGDNLFVCGGTHEPIVKGNVAFSNDALYIGETETFVGLHARLLRASLSTGKLETLHTLEKGMAIMELAVDPPTNRWAFVADDFHYGGKATLIADDGTSRALGQGSFIPRWRGGQLALERDDESGQTFASPSGRFVVRADSDRVTLLDAKTGAVLASAEPPGWFSSGR